jgi:hypothetical protein
MSKPGVNWLTRTCGEACSLSTDQFPYPVPFAQSLLSGVFRRCLRRTTAADALEHCLPRVSGRAAGRRHSESPGEEHSRKHSRRYRTRLRNEDRSCLDAGFLLQYTGGRSFHLFPSTLPFKLQRIHGEGGKADRLYRVRGTSNRPVKHCHPRLFEGRRQAGIHRGGSGGVPHRTPPTNADRIESELAALDRRERATISAQIAGIAAGARPEFYTAEFEEIARKRAALLAQKEAHTPTPIKAEAEPEKVVDIIARALSDLADVLQADEITVAEKHALLTRVVAKIVPHTERKPGARTKLKAVTLHVLPRRPLPGLGIGTGYKFSAYCSQNFSTLPALRTLSAYPGSSATLCAISWIRTRWRMNVL